MRPRNGSIHCTLVPIWAGRLGKTSCVRNNSVSAVEPCSAQTLAIAVKTFGRAAVPHGTLEL